MTFETKAINTSTSAHNEHPARTLFDATIQFCAQQGQTRINEAYQYEKLFFSFVDDIDRKTRKLISCHLAPNHNTPSTIACYMAMESIDIAVPFLLISQAFRERDLLQLVSKLGNSHLLILARRSDITPPVAVALMALNDNLINQVLSKNPALKTTECAQSLKTDQSDDIGNDSTGGPLHPTSPADELLELAQLAGKGRGSEKSKLHQANQGITREQHQTIGERLFTHAKSNNRSLVAREIADQIGMEFEQIKKIVMHEDCQSLVVFLKGLELSKNEASQLLIRLNYSVTHDISQLNRYIEQFERLTTPQCHDIMRNLGAKRLSTLQYQQSLTPDGIDSDNAISEWHRQARRLPTPQDQRHHTPDGNNSDKPIPEWRRLARRLSTPQDQQYHTPDGIDSVLAKSEWRRRARKLLASQDQQRPTPDGIDSDKTISQWRRQIPKTRAANPDRLFLQQPEPRQNLI